MRTSPSPGRILKDKLKKKQVTLGIWVTLESPTISEVAGYAGLDWICIDTEHGHLDFKEVVEHLRAAKGGKVAILGSVAVMYPRTPEVLLAAITVRLRRLCRTMVNNSKDPSKATGLYDRQVTGRFTKAEWAKFSQSIRNQLDDLVVHVNELSEDRPRKKDDKHNCGMSVFLWED